MYYNIALIGFGGVNRALADIIATDEEKFYREMGFNLRIVAVSDMFLGSVYTPEGIDLTLLAALPVAQGACATLPNGKATAENEDIIKNSNADIVVEATVTDSVTGQPATSHCRWALSTGKHVSTTNKGPLAFAEKELMDLALKNNVGFEYEGVVMSGTPVLRFADKLLKGSEIHQFSGILNGTANYVLGLVEQGHTFADAITSAQKQGYAEADPSADVEGKDVMLKVIVLANRLWGANLTRDNVQCQGITGLTETMVKEAVAEGCHWKLVGKASKQEDGSVVASVSPEKLSLEHPLAGISGAVNAITFTSGMLGDVTVSGPGAGRIETAYAILSDIIAIHQRKEI
ncbi:MAG: homoserine dehydrogenase [Porticoccaceae bacterium]|nr:homoserine dehydrogenase [Porticoccaceae bacterium]|tara:strand:- start:169 stop:1206 length:1038 start_codon:yes stop_codon:yes gene_type:complete